MEIVSAAICAGIFNDLGSGSNVDLCIITKASFVTNFDKLVLCTNFQIQVAQTLGTLQC
jgi:hypothetical protein